MGSRLDLQALLEGLVGPNKVYFQPPESISLTYPCVVYKRSDISVEYANNEKYGKRKRYSVTIIDSNPDSDLPELISMIPYSSFDRHFTKDNLNHDVYTLYF